METNRVADRQHGGAIEKQRSRPPDDWRDGALCLQFDGDMWFPEKGASPAAAKLLCGRCEVRGECLEFALDTHEEFGIWGGLSTARAPGIAPTPAAASSTGPGRSRSAVRSRRARLWPVPSGWGGSLMTAVHEVIARSGECLYRGADVELACEIYESSPVGTRLVCHRDGPAPAEWPVDEPIPFRLPAVDEAIGYALTAAGEAAALFVVDTTDVAALRQRCPALFTRRSSRALGGRGRSAS